MYHNQYPVDSLQASVPYLKKIFDSDKFGFKKLKIKVFEIDYEKFNKLLNE
jgi:hypothetical protein